MWHLALDLYWGPYVRATHLLGWDPGSELSLKSLLGFVLKGAGWLMPGSKRHSCKACSVLGPVDITIVSNKDDDLFFYFKDFQ